MDNDGTQKPTSPETRPTAAETATRRDLDTLADAAIDAELETGQRETSLEAARAHLLVRLTRGVVGLVVAVVGVALTVLPGPGVLLILAGLGILAVDYPFAARLRDRLLTTGGHLAGRAGRILRRFLVGAALLILAAGALLLLAIVLIVRTFA